MREAAESTVQTRPAAAPAPAQPADVPTLTRQLENVVKRLLNDTRLPTPVKEQMEVGVRDISSDLKTLGLTDAQIEAIIDRASKDRVTFSPNAAAKGTAK
jgi:hypothetical protein